MPKKYHLSRGIYNFVISVIGFLSEDFINHDKTMAYENLISRQKIALG
jgi:hypothetical protein